MSQPQENQPILPLTPELSLLSLGILPYLITITMILVVHLFYKTILLRFLRIPLYFLLQVSHKHLRASNMVYQVPLGWWKWAGGRTDDWDQVYLVSSKMRIYVVNLEDETDKTRRRRESYEEIMGRGKAGFGLVERVDRMREERRRDKAMGVGVMDAMKRKRGCEQEKLGRK